MQWRGVLFSLDMLAASMRDQAPVVDVAVLKNFTENKASIFDVLSALVNVDDDTPAWYNLKNQFMAAYINAADSVGPASSDNDLVKRLVRNFRRARSIPAILDAFDRMDDVNEMRNAAAVFLSPFPPHLLLI
jgi:hypothetical protein